jgi:hypothetical protein
MTIFNSMKFKTNDGGFVSFAVEDDATISVAVTIDESRGTGFNTREVSISAERAEEIAKVLEVYANRVRNLRILNT